jgi:chromosome segregation ATPase
MTTLAILENLAKPSDRAAADLKADLARIDLQVLEAEVDPLEQKRRRLLVTGTDAEVLAVTQELSAANLAAERAQAMMDEIQCQISEAEAREAAQALEASYAEANNAKARLDQLGDELTAQATRLARAIGTAEEAITDIRARNKKFVAAGRPELQLKVPDIVLWKRHLQAYIR